MDEYLNVEIIEYNKTSLHDPFKRKFLLFFLQCAVKILKLFELTNL